MVQVDVYEKSQRWQKTQERVTLLCTAEGFCFLRYYSSICPLKCFSCLWRSKSWAFVESAIKVYFKYRRNELWLKSWPMDMA